MGKEVAVIEMKKGVIIADGKVELFHNLGYINRRLIDHELIPEELNGKTGMFVFIEEDE